MIPVIQDFTIDRRAVSVSLPQVPELSVTTRKIFIQIGRPLPAAPAPLQNTISSLNQTIAELAEARQHKVRDRAVAILKLVLPVVLIVAGVALTILFGPVGLAVLLPAALGAMVLAGYNMNQAFPGFNQHQPNETGTGRAIIAVLAGLFGPIYQAFTRISNLEESEAKQRQELLLGKQDFQRYLEESVAFYTTSCEATRQQLDERMEQLQTNIGQLESISMDTAALRTRLADMQAAQRAIDSAWRYFSNI